MNIFSLYPALRRKTARTTTARLIDELEEQRVIVEPGFFCGASPVQRMAAASALGSMKTIIRKLKKSSHLDCSVKGTQAEDLPSYLEGKKK